MYKRISGPMISKQTLERETLNYGDKSRSLNYLETGVGVGLVMFVIGIISYSSFSLTRSPSANVEELKKAQDLIVTFLLLTVVAEVAGCVCLILYRLHVHSLFRGAIAFVQQRKAEVRSVTGVDLETICGVSLSSEDRSQNWCEVSVGDASRLMQHWDWFWGKLLIGRQGQFVLSLLLRQVKPTIAYVRADRLLPFVYGEESCGSSEVIEMYVTEDSVGDVHGSGLLTHLSEHLETRESDWFLVFIPLVLFFLGYQTAGVVALLVTVPFAVNLAFGVYDRCFNNVVLRALVKRHRGSVGF